MAGLVFFCGVFGGRRIRRFFGVLRVRLRYSRVTVVEFEEKINFRIRFYGEGRIRFRKDRRSVRGVIICRGILFFNIILGAVFDSSRRSYEDLSRKISRFID